MVRNLAHSGSDGEVGYRPSVLRSRREWNQGRVMVREAPDASTLIDDAVDRMIAEGKRAREEARRLAGC